jgi:MarR family transcriptional regulator for hemolysin
MPKSRAAPAADSLYEFTNALQPVRRAWVQAAGIALADSGLSVSLATTVLLVARHDGGMRQNVLAEEVGVNPATMVRTLDHAEAVGLLERRDVAGDRRARTVFALPEGRNLATRMERSITKLRASLLGDVPEKDIETATEVLRLFEERIGAFLQQERTNR